MTSLELDPHFDSGRFISFLLLTFCLVAFGQAGSSGLEIKQKNRTIDISVIKRVTQQYYLLTNENPLELSIAGPNWLRVYTRLLFKAEMKEKAAYKIVVGEGEEERIVSLETEKSNSSFGPANQKFGKWRSFFIEVPKGVSNYKFNLWQAPSDTIAIRFSIEKPKEWKVLEAHLSTVSGRLVAEEVGKVTDYYELGPNESIKLQLDGPLRLKLGARLNYDVTMEGAQKFTVIVLENGKELQRATFRVGKSETAKYQNKTEVIPSTDRTFYLQIPEGKHQLEFQLTETVAKSAGLRFLSKAPEKYE
jgi:hypothetical protein